MNLNDPPEPDYSDYDYCTDCRSPIFEDGCDCKNYCWFCGELFSRDVLTIHRTGKQICPECNSYE